MDEDGATHIKIEGNHQSVVTQSDGGILIRDRVISEIVKSGVAVASTMRHGDGDVKPLISITIK